MKEFKNGDFIDGYTLEIGEIIKYEDKYLKVKMFEGNKNPCEKCGFRHLNYCGWYIACTLYTTPDEYGNQEIDYEVIYEELSEIEVLVLLGDKNEKV